MDNDGETEDSSNAEEFSKSFSLDNEIFEDTRYSGWNVMQQLIIAHTDTHPLQKFLSVSFWEHRHF